MGHRWPLSVSPTWWMGLWFARAMLWQTYVDFVVDEAHCASRQPGRARGRVEMPTYKGNPVHVHYVTTIEQFGRRQEMALISYPEDGPRDEGFYVPADLVEGR